MSQTKVFLGESIFCSAGTNQCRHCRVALFPVIVVANKIIRSMFNPCVASFIKALGTDYGQVVGDGVY